MLQRFIITLDAPQELDTDDVWSTIDPDQYGAVLIAVTEHVQA